LFFFSKQKTVYDITVERDFRRVLSRSYITNCNRLPGRSCNCRCNYKGCDHRRVCCNVFRYGQCNTQIGGVTEVVCRLITCTPPWKWDPSCGRTVRTDNATRTHTSRCLPGTNPTRIEIKYQDMGLRGSVLGDPTTAERDAVRNGRKRGFENGLILWHRDHGAHEVHGPIATRYRNLSADAGALGYPRTDQRAVNGGGAYNRFERGSIYYRGATGARSVLGRTDQRYRSLGGPTGKLGFPVESTKQANGAGKVTNFNNGAIYVSPDTDPVEVLGEILEVYRSRGGPAGSGIGFPIRVAQNLANGSRTQDFENGLIARGRGQRPWVVRDPIAVRYRRADGPGGWWGYPTAHTAKVADGLVSTFSAASAYWSADTGTHRLNGPVLEKYGTEGGPTGYLGFPTSDVSTEDATGVQRATFESGDAIVYDPNTGQTNVVGPNGTP